MSAAELNGEGRHEMIEYGLNVVCLSVVFACLTVYRRLLLADHGIVLGNYWVAVTEGLVLAPPQDRDTTLSPA